MADHQKDRNISKENRPVPSQAEGEDNGGNGGQDRPVPAQAEGDLETVEDDLKRKR